MGTAHGAAALHVHTGAIEAGREADFIAIDLNDISLLGYTADTLDAIVALSAQPCIIRDAWVSGHQIIADRIHKDTHQIAERFKKVAERLW
jgi:cytosine/adenosine deaminase-related metal-dependent hydrolase